MSNTKKIVGNWGEKKAEEFLIKSDYLILDRNVRTTHGEIDIVAEKNGIITFVEVKTRTNDKFGNPEDAVDKKKKTKLIESALAFMQDHPELEDTWQIDVIAVYQEYSKEIKLLHFLNAVDEYE